MSNRDIGNEILEGLNEIKGFKDGKLKLRTTTLSAPSEPSVIRSKLKLSQAAFAGFLGVSKRTLQDWEQERRNPEGPARALLQVASKNPEAVMDALWQ